MIAITGANGLLGSYITQAVVEAKQPTTVLVRAGARLQLIDHLKDRFEQREADVLDMPSLLEGLQNADTVIHAAGFVSFNPSNRDKIFQVNVEGTRNLVNACLKLGIPKLIHVSSVAALGRTKETLQVNEDSKWVDSHMNTHYAESKHLAELEVYRGMEEGLHVSIVNPSVILAPVKSGQSSAQLFTYVEKEWGFYGDGIMNYVDVRDVAQMILQLCSDKSNGERFIASAGAASLKEILQGIATRLGKRKPTIRIPAALSMAAGRLEEWRALLTGSEPLLSRQSVKILQENFYFQNNKAVDKLGIRFRTLNETLDWCCAEFSKPSGK